MEDIKISNDQIKSIKNVGRYYESYIKKAVANYPIAYEYIMAAQGDLETAKILNKEKNVRTNPQIATSIQQSVEKFTKAYALIFGAISKKSMREIGHLSGKAFVRSLRNQDLGKMFKNLRKISNLMYEDKGMRNLPFLNLSKEADKLENLILNKDFLNFEIKEILDYFEMMRFNITKTMVSRKFNNQFYKQFTILFRPIIKKFYNTKVLDEQKTIFVAQYDLLCFLYPMVFITQKHDIMARYPSFNKKEYSPSDYIKGNPQIIKEKDRILLSLDKINERLTALSNIVKKISDIPQEQRDALFNKIFRNV